MNKNQGATIGAIMLAGIMLRPPSGSLSPFPGDSAITSGSVQSSSLSSESNSQGPWLASCRYWSVFTQSAPVSQPSEVSGTVASTTGDLDWEVKTGSGDNDQGCGDRDFQRWGFPVDGTPVKIDAIIATVPDPVHTHLALAFDRTIDAILQAAAEADFVSSYYWLPWKNHSGALRPSETLGDVEPGHNALRERQPGLIVLKHVQPSFPSEVIYLFLVAESPTQGVNGFQLQNAFASEEEIGQWLPKQNTFSTGGESGVAIIGPMYSGSAASLRAGIETIQRSKSTLKWNTLKVIGATSTVSASDVLNISENAPNAIHYLSFGPDQAYQLDQFIGQLKGAGMDPAKMALLVEDNTALGNYTLDKLNSSDLPLVIRFPREISLLRNAEVGSESNESDLSAAGLPQSPYLHLSLKDSSARDSVPQFSRENTPLSQESQLMTIARQVHRFRAQFIGIVASDVLDELFLAKLLHRMCPDATIVFFQSDLLEVREGDDTPFVGSVSLSPYHLIGMRQDDSPRKRAYTDSTSLAYYNATIATIRDITRNERLTLQYYQGHTESGGDHRVIKHPLLWATTVGLDGYYPLGIINTCGSSSPNILPSLYADWSQPVDANGKAQPCGDIVARLDPELSIATIYPAQLWTLLCWLVLLVCLCHTAVIWLADPSSPLSRDLAIKDNDQPHRRSMYIQVGTVMLFAMSFMVTFPVISLALMIKVSKLSLATSAATISLGALALIITMRKSWAYLAGEHALVKGLRLQIAYYDGIVRSVRTSTSCSP